MISVFFSFILFFHLLFRLLFSLFSLFFSLSLSLCDVVCVVVCGCVCVGGLVCGVCGVRGVRGVRGVCGSDDSQHGESVLARADYAPNWVAEHLGASSRRPRHPFSALMARNPWLCTCAHSQKKRHASGHVINLSRTMPTAEPHRTALSGPAKARVWLNTGMLILVEELQPWNLMVCRTVWTMGTKLCATKGM